MSRLALRSPRVRGARPACAVFTLDGSCGVGVFRRLLERAAL
jgi:hypothetical protein